MGEIDESGKTITEIQFLEMSDRERDGFVRIHVYGKPPKVVEHWITHSDLDRENDENYVPRYTTTWDGMGIGIEHANENGYSFMFTQYTDKEWQVCAFSPRHHLVNVTFGENILLAFWIAYLKALGIISEKTN